MNNTNGTMSRAQALDELLALEAQLVPLLARRATLRSIVLTQELPPAREPAHKIVAGHTRPHAPRGAANTTVLKTVAQGGPLTAPEITALLDNQWAVGAIRLTLSRLLRKGFVHKDTSGELIKWSAAIHAEAPQHV